MSGILAKGHDRVGSEIETGTRVHVHIIQYN